MHKSWAALGPQGGSWQHRTSSLLTTPHPACTLSFSFTWVSHSQTAIVLSLSYPLCLLFPMLVTSSSPTPIIILGIQSQWLCARGTCWLVHGILTLSDSSPICCAWHPHHPLSCTQDWVQTPASHRLNTMLVLHKNCAWEPEPPIILL